MILDATWQNKKASGVQYKSHVIRRRFRDNPEAVQGPRILLFDSDICHRPHVHILTSTSLSVTLFFLSKITFHIFSFHF